MGSTYNAIDVTSKGIGTWSASAAGSGSAVTHSAAGVVSSAQRIPPLIVPDEMQVVLNRGVRTAAGVSWDGGGGAPARVGGWQWRPLRLCQMAERRASPDSLHRRGRARRAGCGGTCAGG